MSRQSSKTYKRASFKAPRLKEISDELVNPYRGWYQIHTFKLDEDIDMTDREYTLNHTDTLALILVDISAYRSSALDDKAINNLRIIFAFFRDYRLDMIVRVVYDTVGKCLETEPSEETTIMEHMDQLVPIMKDYAANIFVYQGLLIGNWGEMHSSKFLSPARLSRLATDFLENIHGTAFLAVRRPAYVRILFPEGEDLRQNRVGIFDDAILASPTHLGTFGEKPAKDVRREQSWLPKEEIKYVSSLCDRVPYGGEGLYSEEKDAISSVRQSLKAMSEYFSTLHVTYLNRIHDINFVEHLKTLKWNGRDLYRGMDGYEYIGRHLGYRFVLRKVACSLLESDNSILRWDITIENIGFARIFFKNGCTMRATDIYGNEVVLELADWIELNQIASGEKHTFVCMTPVVVGKVYLSFTKEDTKQAIYFANRNQIDSEFNSEIYLGSIKLH